MGLYYEKIILSFTLIKEMKKYSFLIGGKHMLDGGTGNKDSIFLHPEGILAEISEIFHSLEKEANYGP